MPTTGSHVPRKRFGQHFLHDPSVVDRIVAAIDPRPGQAMVEIGPGQGVLTYPLLRRVGTLDVVELDRDLGPALEAGAQGLGSLRVHQADALHFDFAALAPARASLRVVGNLPYNISTPLLFHLLAPAQAGALADLHLMLQREVVDRLAAGPGSGRYGRLSVMVQYRCQVQRLFTIGAGAFRPPPKVESGFVRLVPYAQPPVEVPDERLFAALVTQAFGQRRKTLRNALRGTLDEALIRAAGIDPGARAQTLSLQDYASLTRVASEGGSG